MVLVAIRSYRNMKKQNDTCVMSVQVNDIKKKGRGGQRKKQAPTAICHILCGTAAMQQVSQHSCGGSVLLFFWGGGGVLSSR